MDKKDRIRELVELLNKASYEYYQKANEIMSNFEYDRLYDELVALEEETGIVLANSPTINVGYEVVSELPKEKHESPMLSLDKTKEIDGLRDFAGEQKCLVSWKLDGLTVVLTYRDGQLFKAVTRGNGTIGEVVTNNAKTFKNLPHTIPYKGELVIRGEAIIKYSDFEKINEQIEDADAKYKNPRNLCAGSVRQLNSKITSDRNVNLMAFALISATDVDFGNSIESQLEWLKAQGFDVVEYKVAYEKDMEETIGYFANKIKGYDLPSDGLVVVYDDIEYGISLGRTAKFPRNGIAFKWADEQAETVLEEIEWSPSRTGLINPVAIFKSVELEGTTVSRASLHNISIMEALELGIGDSITVYKANMIIPQIADNLTRSGIVDIPTKCPACGGKTSIKEMNGTKTLYCDNTDCPAKHIKAYSHFVSRDAMNIEGLSEETLQKFIEKGFIKEYADIFKLDRYKDAIVEEKGFGIKSYNKIIEAVENARKVLLPNFIFSLGILNVGLANAKVICKFFEYDIQKLINSSRDELLQVEGVGSVIADTFVSYFEDFDNISKLNNLLDEVEIIVESNDEVQNLEGKTFVITGKVFNFENRNELKDFIEKRGGKVASAVSANTDYLINNDSTSNSGKNKKAKELGIAIITEQEFLDMN